MKRQRHGTTDGVYCLKLATGARIHEALSCGGVSVAMAARLLRVSRWSVYRWQEGAVQPSIDNVLGLANITGVSPSWLIHGTEMPLEEALALAERQQRQYTPFTWPRR